MKKDIQFHNTFILVRMKRFLLGMFIAQAIVLMAFSLTKYENKPQLLSSEIGELTYDPIDLIQYVSETAPKPKLQKQLQEDPFSKEPEITDTTTKPDEQDDTQVNTSGLEVFIAAHGVNMKKEDEDIIYDGFAVSQNPEFPGGVEEMIKFIKKHYSIPYSAKLYEVKGVALICFVVNKDGIINDIHVANPERALGYGIEEEAKRVIALMPEWKPGMQAYRKVNVRVVIPIVIE